ncbi:MAG: DUF3784 domain-containing protein [Peptoniphilus grossensis]|uniref:DUF3784 domain-containing protein n=1 Tax=Peptoniphilus grossensis TaxID=1465756 RepID=UPI00290DDF5C|nr:DUF3784 domain-containing protein [Peptoniphilus grossensis]MDU7150912.1 DUF3784 domain-containing protein [Peptoniphilus grossensis]
MILLMIILLVVGVAFTTFGYFIYFKEKYNLINGFESDYKSGRKSETYAKKVGLVEFMIGIIIVVVGFCMFIIK